MLKRLFKIFMWIVIFFFASTILTALLYRYVPVYYTPLMLIRAVESKIDGKEAKISHEWVPYQKIAPSLTMAVISSEDNRFMEHNGLDFDAIEKAVDDYNKKGRKRGGSTITQQTAKNVFLWPESSWVRKGFEVYFTYLIEITWNKKRIMEVYLNSIEMGKGIYGAQAVAREHFNTTADRLSASQCALVAATLPNPLRFNSAAPSAYMQKRQRQILSLMTKVPRPDFLEKK